MYSILKFMATSALAALLIGCGGEDTRSEEKHSPPTSKPGLDQRVKSGDRVVLDGSQSTGFDGVIVEYSWVQQEGENVILEKVEGKPAVVQFDAPYVVGETVLTFALVVYDEERNTHSDRVSITVVGSSPPLPDAGEDQAVRAFDTVELVGAYVDGDIDVVAVSWEQVSGTVVALNQTNPSTLTFEAPDVALKEELIFRFSLEDARSMRYSDDVKVAVTPILPPTINLPDERSVTEGSEVEISVAVDAENQGELTFTWTQIAGTQVALQGSTTSSLSFRAPLVSEPEDLLLELAVTNAYGKQSKAQIKIIVKLSPPPNVLIENMSVKELEDVVLEAQVHDDDESIEFLDLVWEQIGDGPKVDAQANGTTLAFRSPSVNDITTLKFRLTATDSHDERGSAEVSVTVSPNSRPLANAGEDKTVFLFDLVELDGSKSTDADSAPNLLRYEWKELTEHGITLSDKSAITPHFEAPEVDKLITAKFELTVSDNKGKTHSDTVDVIIKPLGAVGEVSVTRLSRPGRIEVSWLPVDGADRYDIEIVHAKGLEENRIFDDQRSPVVLPAAFNDYMHHEISVVARKKTASKSSRAVSTDFEKFMTNPNFACGMRNGGLQCWGAEYSHGFRPQPIPLHPPKIESLQSVVSSRNTESMCLLDANTVKCWGRSKSVPMDLLNPRLLTSTPDENEFCVIDNADVVCWGHRDSARRALATLLGETITEVSHLVVGRKNGCVVDGGKLKCWHDDGEAVAGIPQEENLVPEQLFAIDNSLCMLNNGKITCWGEDDRGIVSDAPDVDNITELEYSRYHACVIDSGAVYCWGGSNIGQGAILPPDDIETAKQLALGEFYSCALTENGVRCWGKPFYDHVQRGLERVLGQLSNPRHIAASETLFCAIDDKGLLCAGLKIDREHELYRKLRKPEKISFPCAIDENKVVCLEGYNVSNVPPGIIDPRKLYYNALDNVACVLASSGVTCWGNEGSSLLNVPDLVNPRDFALFTYGACAVDDDGVKCWRNSTEYKSVIDGAADAPLDLEQLVLGDELACGLSGGSPYCWGNRSNYLSFENSGSSLLTACSRGGYDIACTAGDGSIMCDNYSFSTADPEPWNQDIPVFDVITDLGHHCNYQQYTLTKCNMMAIVDNELRAWGPDSENVALQDSTPLLSNPDKIVDERCVTDENGMLCWGTGANTLDGWRFRFTE